ncbi:MAG: thiol-disulfide oxidoreductase DCC family protein [Fluviicola sp.]|jgi:predicted DCC family thiol-disulfide oxidoreductase YuxK
MQINSNRIVYFDGVCNLCESSVQFIIRKNKKKNIQFASLQGSHGQAFLKENNFDTSEFSSLVYVENGKIYTKSSGALRITKQLKGLWPMMICFLIIPKFIRDGVYTYVAKNRYKWYGKKTSCWLPTPELKKRFLD